MDKNKVEEVRKFVEENKRWPRVKETRIYGICLAARNYYNQNKLRNYYRLKEEEAKEIIEIMEPYKNGGRIYVQRFKDFIVKNKKLPNSNKPEERVLYFTYYSALAFPIYKHPGPYIKLKEQEAREIMELVEKYNKKKDKVERFRRFIMRKIFCCYSVDLKHFLSNNGIRYDLCALNPNNSHMFWAYVRNEKLDKFLNEWSNRKS